MLISFAAILTPSESLGDGISIQLGVSEWLKNLASSKHRIYFSMTLLKYAYLRNCSFALVEREESSSTEIFISKPAWNFQIGVPFAINSSANSPMPAIVLGPMVV